MNRVLIFLAAVAWVGCSAVKLVVVNTMSQPIKDIEIKLGSQSTRLAELAAGASHEQKVKVEKDTSINVNFQNARGQQFYASTSEILRPGEGGSLTLSVTAQGNLEATRVK